MQTPSSQRIKCDAFKGMKKILIIRLSSLGDIILSFPLLKKLKEKFPGSEIHFLTKKAYEEIVSINPNVNKVILYDGNLKETRVNSGKEDYDLIIDIHKNFRSVFVSMFNGNKVVRYKKENLKKFLLVKFKINLFKRIIPVYEKYMRTVGFSLNDSDYKFSVSELRFSKDNITGSDYIVVAPSSRHFTKTYPATKFIKYISELGNKKVVLVGDNSAKDKETCSYIEASCSNVLNLCGKLDLKALANILFNSDFVITNDSALMHFAEAVGKKVIALFGSTVKEFGFFPQLKDSSVIENLNLKCRPCTHIGRENCPLGHFKCMMELGIGEW